MNIFKLTRIEMVRLLYSLKGLGDISPLDILVKSANMSAEEAASHLQIPEFLTRYERKNRKKNTACQPTKSLSLAIYAS